MNQNQPQQRISENRVIVFDTTLRDGEQSPGASLTSHEKLEIAHQLARLRVDIIEAGFPVVSPDEFEGVRQIAAEVGTADGPIICGLARAIRNDIDLAWRAVRAAAHPRIHMFMPTSDIHMEAKLRLSRREVLARVAEMVSYAKERSNDVEFSPEDACRSDPAFLVEVLSNAIAAGATTLNIPDTVGYFTPTEMSALITRLRAETDGSERVVWSVHCHDDLGLSTANSLAAISAGARQVEVTVNGIGDRAGNTSLEEIVMTLHTRHQYFGLTTGIETTQLTHTSRMVSSSTGIPVPPNKAVVGANAFAHEAGIHQDGMLKDRRTYEIMTPETVGLCRPQLVLGKHSGRHGLCSRLADLGFELDDNEIDQAFRRFKDLADKKKTITEADLEFLMTDSSIARNGSIPHVKRVACWTSGSIQREGTPNDQQSRTSIEY